MSVRRMSIKFVILAEGGGFVSDLIQVPVPV